MDGGDWLPVGTCSPGSASSWGSSSMSITEAGDNVKVRFSANSATIYLTDIRIASLPDPVLTVSPDSLDLGVVFAGEISDPDELSVTALYLSSDILISANEEGFEVSRDGSDYGKTATLYREDAYPATIKVFNSAGQFMCCKEVLIENASTRMFIKGISGLSSGIYLVSLEQGSKYIHCGAVRK